MLSEFSVEGHVQHARNFVESLAYFWISDDKETPWRETPTLRSTISFFVFKKNPRRTPERDRTLDRIACSALPYRRDESGCPECLKSEMGSQRPQKLSAGFTNTSAHSPLPFSRETHAQREKLDYM